METRQILGRPPQEVEVVPGKKVGRVVDHQNQNADQGLEADLVTGRGIKVPATSTTGHPDIITDIITTETTGIGVGIMTGMTKEDTREAMMGDEIEIG